MSQGWKTGVVAAVAFTSLTVGVAAGIAVGRSQGARTERERGTATAGDGAGRAPAAEPAQDRRADDRARLAQTAAALRQVPQLQIPPEPPAPASTSPRQRLVMEELPASVQNVLRQLTLGKALGPIELERREHRGTPYIKAEFDVDGLEHEYALDDAGKVLATEQDLPVSDLPAPVTAAIAAAFPGAVLLEAERDQVGNDPVFYEVEVRHQDKQMELHVGETGSILRQRVR